MKCRVLRLGSDAPFRLLIGVGGIGTGTFFALEGNHTLGRNDSRPGRLLDVRDYCKLHIVAHYVSVLLGADPAGSPFHVLPIGKVGEDLAGHRLMQEMAAVGMDLRFVDMVSTHPTLQSVCFQYPDGSGGNITTTDSAASSLPQEDVNRAEPILASHGASAICAAMPEVPLDARLHLLELATRHDAFRVASFASAEIAEAREKAAFSLVDLLALNQDEGMALTGKTCDPGDPEALLHACAEVLTQEQPAISLVLTFGSRGAYAYADAEWDFCPALTVPVASTAGAGDALLGGVLACLAAGLPLVCPGRRRTAIGDAPLETALDFGVLLAAFSVTSPHTIHSDANLASICSFAADHGLRFGGGLQNITTPS